MSSSYPYPWSASLPRDLALARQTLTSAGTHPVILLFSKQYGVRLNLLPAPLSMFDYLECVYCVPFGRHAGCCRTSLTLGYVPRLFLNALLPTASGIFFYGLPKQLARISWHGEKYEVRAARSAEPIISAKVRPGSSGRPARDFPWFEKTWILFEQRQVSRNMFWRWQYYFFDFVLITRYLSRSKRW